jgi:hypothetical protein
LPVAEKRHDLSRTVLSEPAAHVAVETST